MSDIKLFHYDPKNVTELVSSSAPLEKDLQNLIEGQLETFLGTRFLTSEYSTGKTHKGRIDTLGLDENNCPVIIEYKRHSNENVINQGLFYLDWLLDHKAEFRWLVMEKMDKNIAESIEWGGTRLICIASDFNRYDEHAVQQINRNVELMRYRYFGSDLLLLELVNAQTAEPATSSHSGSKARTLATNKKSADKTQEERLAEATPELLNLYNKICDFADGLGDEVQRKELKLYTAFKRIKNFLCIVVLPRHKDPRLQLYLKLDPAEVGAEEPFSRDVTNIGHWATGNLELNVRNESELEKTLALIMKSYQEN